MNWTTNFKDFLKKKTNIDEKYPITADSFLDVHYHYDKNDFIFSWKELLDSNRELWTNSLANASADKKILIATLGGGFSHRHIMSVDNLLSLALTLRGAKTEILLCDHALPVCLKAEHAYIKPEIIHHSQISQTLCKGCYKDSASVALQFGLVTHMMNHFVTPDQRRQAHLLSKELSITEINTYKINNVDIGKHAVSGLMRYFSNSEPLQLPLGEQMLRRFFEASIITYHALTKLLTENKYEAVCFTHATYVPHGIVKEVCDHLNITVISWAITALRNRFIFSKGEQLNSLLHESNQSWENFQWTETQEKRLIDYLNSRWGNSNDWLPIPKENNRITFNEFAKQKNINLEKPIVGLLTNIMWEAYAEYKSRVFPDMLKWIEKTIKYFSKRKDLQLLIRIHPAEAMRDTNKQYVLEIINKMFPKLPSNVFIVEPTINLSTYEAMQHCDAAIIYQTQTGIELAAMMGMPVIVAGDAWIRNKGISYDPESEEEYFSFLNQLPFKKCLSEDKIQRARKFAYHAFFRRTVPFNFFEETKDWLLIKSTLKKLDELLPNNHKGLDIVCDGIMNGTPFIYPYEDELSENI